MEATTLLAFIPMIANAHLVPQSRASEAANAIVEVVREEPVLPFQGATDEEKRNHTKMLLFVWSYFESGWNKNALGDGGQSCGAMQTNRMFSNCSLVRKDLRESYRAAFKVLRIGVERCGTIKGALGMYATGKCNGSLPLVTRRCAIAKIAC